MMLLRKLCNSMESSFSRAGLSTRNQVQELALPTLLHNQGIDCGKVPLHVVIKSDLTLGSPSETVFAILSG
jgi:hypothetical protein